MDSLKLVRPGPEHKGAAESYVREHREHGETELHGASLLERMECYNDWLAHLEKQSREETVGEDWVPSSTFFAVRESDGKVVGVIDIRHRLNAYLRQYGGHIGYGVLPSERRKGYATVMLRLALDYCRDTLELPRVMIACDKANPASARTIRACGGVLERELLYTDGSTVQVHWAVP